jgi:mannose-1-phosphate guanylyltransferase
MDVYSIIMAGGTGTRLWPLSTELKPKQTHRLIGEYTMFQDAVRRIEPITGFDHIMVVASNHHMPELHRQEPNIPKANFIVEPEGRGTAPCIGLAATHLTKINPESIMVVLTADHYIGNVEEFRKALKTSIKAASKGYLVTLGIEPTEPSTGYGYIEHGPILYNIQGLNVFRVNCFREKPDKETAVEMIESGNYSWNSGMFIWKVERILGEFRKQMPALYNQLMTIMEAVGSPEYMEVLEKAWGNVPRETIDYGIMEKADNVAVIPVDIDWSDLGSWSSVMKLLPSDSHGNVVKGKHLGKDTFSSMIMGEDRLIATIGVRDLIIVDTGEAILICDKSQDQKVRELVKNLPRDAK